MGPIDDHQTLQLIDRYLRKQLSETEQHAFEKRLAEDEAFKQVVEEHRMTIELMGALEEENLRNTLEVLGKEYRGEGAAVKPLWENKVLWALAAAAIVLLLLFGPSLFSGTQTTEQFAEQYLKESAKPDVTMLGAEEEGAWVRVQGLYANNDYAAILSELNSFPDSLFIKYPAAKFIEGFSYQQEGQAQQAIAKYLEIPPNTPTRANANWWLALAYLQTGQAEKARPLLEEVSKRGKYRKQAADLLKELN